MKRDFGKLSTLYDINDDIPIHPKTWGQQKYRLVNGSHVKVGWNHVKNAIMKYGIRNSMLLSLMPTASSAQAIRNAESVEYHQTNIYSRNVSSGHFIVMNRWMALSLEKLELWDDMVASFIILCGGSLLYLENFFDDHIDFYPQFFKKEVQDKLIHIVKKFKTQFEISQKHMMNLTRQRGIYIDQSQSFNIFIKDPTVNKLRAMHVYGNEIGLKTGMYYLRSEPPSSSGGFGIRDDVKRYYESLMEKKGISTVMSGRVIYTTKKETTCINCE